MLFIFLNILFLCCLVFWLYIELSFSKNAKRQCSAKQRCCTTLFTLFLFSLPLAWSVREELVLEQMTYIIFQNLEQKIESNTYSSVSCKINSMPSGYWSYHELIDFSRYLTLDQPSFRLDMNYPLQNDSINYKEPIVHFCLLVVFGTGLCLLAECLRNRYFRIIVILPIFTVFYMAYIGSGSGNAVYRSRIHNCILVINANIEKEPDCVIKCLKVFNQAIKQHKPNCTPNNSYRMQKLFNQIKEDVSMAESVGEKNIDIDRE